MLYTGTEIANMYSTDKVRITENTIRNWSKKGLKHVAGPNNIYLYKKEWVEQFLEEEAVKQIIKNKTKSINPITKTRNKIKRISNAECRVV